MEQPLNLSTKKNSPDIDYDDVCLVSCDKGSKKESEESELGAFNPNLLLQQHQLEQYFLLHQQHQQQQQLDSLAKTHLDKYLKLTNRYLHTMSPFLQHFTPLVGQTPALSAQAAATAAASILLTTSSNQQQQQQASVSDDDEKSAESPESSPSINDSVRFFLHKIIEHNFIQQLQQQQQINDLINNNNQQQSSNGTNGSNNQGLKKSPTSSIDESEEFFNLHQQHLGNIQSPAGNNSKSFFDFLKSAAVNSTGGGSANNGISNRSQQGFKR